MISSINRRAVLTTLGGAAVAWPLATRAQQPAMPAVGFLNSASADAYPDRIRAFRQGLTQAGFVEGRNVTIVYRWADNQNDRVPALAADLVRSQVQVIVGNYPAVLAAKAATSAIPIVFTSAADPVKVGLVESLNRPEANVTGVHLMGVALEAKRLELLHQLVAGTALIGVLLNSKRPDADQQVRELQDAAAAIKRQIQIVRANTEPEIDAAITAVAQQGAGAFLVTSDPFFTSRRDQLVALAARYKLPAIYNQRDFAESGGLVSYGSDFAEGYRLAGTYAGKILKGTKPSDLPVMQPTKFELVINLKTAKTLGLAIPQTLLATADQVIE